jgi:phage terminase large subunit-like protein
LTQAPPAVLTELAKFPTEEALKLVQAQRLKRRKDQFVKYWQPVTEAQSSAFRVFKPETKTLLVLGGNRSGKTELGAFLTMAWLLGKEYFRGEPAWELVKDLPIPAGDVNMWVTALDFPTLRDVIWREKLLHGRSHPGLLPKDDSIDIKINHSDYQIQVEVNGRKGFLTGKSADSGREKFQSASIDFAWIDEEPEKPIFDEIYQRTADCAGKILVTLTPLTDIASGIREPWVYELYEDHRDGTAKDIAVVKLSVLDNPVIPAEEKQKLLQKWAGHVEEKARLYGDFVQRSGLVYHMWNPRVHIIAPRALPKDWYTIVSIDPAATGPTAAVWGRVDPESHDVYFTGEYKVSNQVVSEHAKDILVRNAGRPVDLWLVDPTWGRQRNAETHKQNVQLYRESGIPARLPELDEDFGLNVSLEYFQATVDPTSRHPKVYVFEDLYEFRREIEHYTWAVFGKGEMKGLSKEKPLKRNDHLMNAMQYLLALRPKGKRGQRPLSQDERRQQASLNSYT